MMLPGLKGLKATLTPVETIFLPCSVQTKLTQELPASGANFL